jgi:small subunit ribosomal protein S6
LRQYELTFIVRPDIDEDSLAAVIARVQQTITANGGTVLRTDNWGKRRLAYQIRRYSEGYYTLVHTEMNDKAIRETERMLKLSEDVMRHLLVHVEPGTLCEAPAAPAPVPAPAPEVAPAPAPEAAPAPAPAEPEAGADTGSEEGPAGEA